MERYHLTFSSESRNPFFLDEATRREVVLRLARLSSQDKGPVFHFCVVDNHLHVLVLAEAEAVRALARKILLGIRPLAATRIEMAHVKRIETATHMRSALDYVLGQPARHDMPDHPATWTGSCFQDLIGARFIDGFKLDVPRAVPRWRRADACKAVGFLESLLSPVSPEQLRQVPLPRLLEAAACALCAPPGAVGRSDAAVLARATFLQLGVAAGFRVSALADVVGVSRSALYRLGTHDVSEGPRQAVCTRLALENSLVRQLVTEASGGRRCPPWLGLLVQ